MVRCPDQIGGCARQRLQLPVIDGRYGIDMVRGAAPRESHRVVFLIRRRPIGVIPIMKVLFYLPAMNRSDATEQLAVAIHAEFFDTAFDVRVGTPVNHKAVGDGPDGETRLHQ